MELHIKTDDGDRKYFDRVIEVLEDEGFEVKRTFGGEMPNWKGHGAILKLKQ